MGDRCLLAEGHGGMGALRKEHVSRALMSEKEFIKGMALVRSAL